MSEHLFPYLNLGARILDVGSGSRYIAAVLHHLVLLGGQVVGINRIPASVDCSVQNSLGAAIDKGELGMVIDG